MKFSPLVETCFCAAIRFAPAAVPSLVDRSGRSWPMFNVLEVRRPSLQLIEVDVGATGFTGFIGAGERVRCHLSFAYTLTGKSDVPEISNVTSFSCSVSKVRNVHNVFAERVLESDFGDKLFAEQLDRAALQGLLPSPTIILNEYRSPLVPIFLSRKTISPPSTTSTILR